MYSQHTSKYLWDQISDLTLSNEWYDPSVMKQYALLTIILFLYGDQVIPMTTEHDRQSNLPKTSY